MIVVERMAHGFYYRVNTPAFSPPLFWGPVWQGPHTSADAALDAAWKAWPGPALIYTRRP